MSGNVSKSWLDCCNTKKRKQKSYESSALPSSRIEGLAAFPFWIANVRFVLYQNKADLLALTNLQGHTVILEYFNIKE